MEWPHYSSSELNWAYCRRKKSPYLKHKKKQDEKKKKRSREPRKGALGRVEVFFPNSIDDVDLSLSLSLSV